MATLAVEVVTGERIVYERDDASMVVAPGAEGSLGILPRHAPLVSLLKEGELRIKHSGQEDSLAVHGGFIEVLNNRVRVLADTAERTSEIDVGRAEAARQRAEEALRNAKDRQDIAEAEAALRRAIVRLRLARGPRNYGMNRPPG